MRALLVLLALGLAGCHGEPARSYRCVSTRTCPGADPITVEFTSVCGSSPQEAEQTACKGVTCDCSATCTPLSDDPWLC